ncbi:ABC transporter substrate-binding protein [Streptosporangium carneum]|uniref:ABC transporter substrate-binding protein n=1 Tax=Streptosporangium carneum TaxID=47481 RepID=UPI003CD080CF
MTHDLDEALLLGDRIGLLHAGGGSLDVLPSPVTRREELADGSARRALLTHFTSRAERSELGGPDADLDTDTGTGTGTDVDTDTGTDTDTDTGTGTGTDTDTDTGTGSGSGREAHTDTATAGPEATENPGATRREALVVAGALALLSLPVAASALTSKDGSVTAGRTGGGAGSAARGASATLRVGYLPITDAAPLLLAHDSGRFAERGITTPPPILYRGWAPLVEALQGGNVDLVHLLMPLAVQLRYDAKVPVKVLAWNHTNGSALTVAHQVGSVEDLAGTNVAIPAWFSVHNVVLQKLLRGAGVTPVIDTAPSAASRTAQLVVLPPADMPAALESGSISGYIVAEPFCAVGEVRGIGKILRFTGDVWKDHACCVTVVRESLVRDRPDVALRATEAIVAAQLAIRQDREAAAERLSAGGYLPQPLPALRRTLTAHQDPAYVASGAVRHPQWRSNRIDFQPHPYPTYTGELVRAMKETTVDADVSWLDALDPAGVHADLVAVDVSSAAITAAGGLGAFGVTGSRTEVVEL